MPVKEPQDHKYKATTWGGPLVEDLEVPSGQICQVRRPGPEGLIRAGVINSIDSLTGIVQNELIPSADGSTKIDPAKLVENVKAMEEVIHVTDRIVCYVVLQPEIVMTPNDVTTREDGVIYADMVGLEDKMFIMQYALGGTRDLETFRTESAADVASMGAKPKAARKSK